MDDAKRDLNKTKRTKADHVKSTVASYLQKRNYPATTVLKNIDIDHQITFSLVDSEISRRNSVLYSCYNSDPIVIDHGFGKFLLWMKDLLKNKSQCGDLESLVGPLFCHLYLDILKGGHAERATSFFKAHLPAVDRTKCDDFVRELISVLVSEGDAGTLKEQFRSNKYCLELSQESIDCLKKYVAENCHVIFLHILQSWFDLQEIDSKEQECEDQQIVSMNGTCTQGDKFQKMLDVIKDLESQPKQIFSLNISNTKETVTCGLIRRVFGLVAYDQDSVLHLRPIHSYDSIIGQTGLVEVTLSNHSKKIYSIAVTPDGNVLVTASADCTLCMYNLSDLDIFKVCTGHSGPVYHVAASSNNMYVASASHDTTARLWNVENGQTLRLFAGHTQAVTCVAFHPNCLYVATGSADRNLRLWNIENGNPLRLFHGLKGVVYAITFNPLGDSLASVSDDKRLRVWDILTAKTNTDIKYKGEPITKIVWNKNGTELCTGCLGGNIKIWNLGSSKENGTESKNHEPVTSLNVNGKILDLEYSLETFACVSS